MYHNILLSYLGLRQLLVFTGGRIEELLRVLDDPSHGLDRAGEVKNKNEAKC